MYGELRLMRPDGDRKVITQRFYPLRDGLGIVRAEADCLTFMVEGWDVYYGVVPRVRQRGTAADAAPSTNVIWADVDAKNFASKTEAATSLNMFEIPASAIVDSGHGFHAYWFLSEPVEMAQAQSSMKVIARAVGGDAVSDASRVLRVPGTTNYKGTPAPVRLLRFDDARRYRPGDFPVDEVVVKRPRAVVTDVSSFVKLPDWLQQIVKEGAPKGARSEAAFKACLWMIRYGWSEEAIREIFAAYPNGIGEKYAESGDRWLAVTLRAAREAA
jgi:hypothetical protein